MASWLEQGGNKPRRLKKLGLSMVNLSHRGLLRLLRPLAQGRAPIMLRLDLSLNSVETVDGVAAEIQEALAITNAPAAAAAAEDDPPPAAAAGAGAVAGGGIRVLDALWAAALCAMPHLMEIELRDSGVEGEVTRALARALARGAGRRLKRISLGGCSITDQGQLIVVWLWLVGGVSFIDGYGCLYLPIYDTHTHTHNQNRRRGLLRVPG